MRLVRGLLLSTVLVSGAQAADYLRGAIGEPSGYRASTQASYDWSGVYFGGHGSYSYSEIRNTTMAPLLARDAFPHLAATDQIAQIITFPSRTSTNGTGYGFFMGYNTMWDDVVLGVEAEYNRTRVEKSVNMVPISRQHWTSDTSYTNIYLQSGSIKYAITDYGVARVRVGAAYGRFLPYMTFGLAVGRTLTTGNLQGRVDLFGYDTTTGVSTPAGSLSANITRKSNSTAWGYAIGAGMDVSLIDNVFLRGKYEYVAFGGANSTQVHLHTVKAGAGVKF